MPQDKDKQRGKAISNDGDTLGQSGSHSTTAPRKLTAVACVDCRKRKRKCNGERPSCSACQTRGLSCMYDVVEGATRTEDLKQKVVSLTSRVRNLELFINTLRYSTDNEASAILAQLRLGDSIDVILGIDLNEGVPDMSEVEQWKERRQSRDQTLPILKTVSTFGLGLARNPAGPSMLTSIPLYDPARSQRSTSVPTNSPGLLDAVTREASRVKQEYPNSPWAPPLFPESDSQHVLFEDDPYSEPQSAAQERFPGLDGAASKSMYLMGSRERLWIDPMLVSSAPGSTSGKGSVTQERHAKILDRYRERCQMLNDSRSGGDSITICSNLFSGVGQVPLSVPINMQPNSMQDLIAPAWAIASMYRCEDPDMMSAVYIDFVNESKRIIASGVPPDRLFGAFPDVEALLSDEAFQRAPGLSKWTARLANSFGISSLICRMAAMWATWHLMRWLIHRTPETYLAIPDWYRPTPYQMFVPHPIYVDFLFWPRFRDVVIQRIDLQCQPKFWYSEAATTVGCNWPGKFQDAVCYDSVGKLTLSPAFIQHLMDLSNWSIGPIIRKHIPDADTVMQIKYARM